MFKFEMKNIVCDLINMYYIVVFHVYCQVFIANYLVFELKN